MTTVPDFAVLIPATTIVRSGELPATGLATWALVLLAVFLIAIGTGIWYLVDDR